MRIKIFLCLIFLLFYPCISSASGSLNKCGRSEWQEFRSQPSRKSEHRDLWTKETLGLCKTYKVKKGDTLYRISKKTGISVRELKRLNRLNKNIIRSGQILIISKQEKKAEGAVEEISSLSSNFQLKEQLQQSGDMIVGQIEQESSDDLYPEKKETEERNRLIQFALSFLDTPYRKGGTTIRGIDCSGLVWSVFRNAGIDIPRTVRELFFSGKPVGREEILPGDLIFFYLRRSSEPDHVGIYIGEDKFIHASRRARKVIITELNEYFINRFAGIRRFFE